MSLEKVTFTNKTGDTLVGRLELPSHQEPHNFALFAHCFTCTKNLSAVRNISRELTAKGFGVLRFDFTGLGESEGDFENTNFSGNVSDLIAAAAFLEDQYKAPVLLIGHSLGGAAVIYAADAISTIKAVATIGAPSDPAHVAHLFKSDLQEIEANGKAVVNLSGRDFTIKKQFIEDLRTKSMPQSIAQLRKPILIMHSPQDTTVGIKNAEEIYKAAHHPKSFVSLDGADHLLMQKKDSEYVGTVISGWAVRYVDIPETPELKSKHQIVASLDHDAGFSTPMKIGNHQLMADEPLDVGGKDYGPSPYELVAAGLAACTAMTIQMYARRKKWHVAQVEVHISHDKSYAKDCEDCDTTASKIDTFTRDITLKGDLNTQQRERLLEIANKCPVHRTLYSETRVITNLHDKL
ncbi:bifunctional alpha/beta hydrolase/OsmC family protein [Arenibacter sp. GZD96]|uniref:bifunctional alpha/beta hydrolase/OsmC family protein n=1 Tax=Aurantibrevibacter litoralis TaxID=3106030 RepID=UPI002AFE212B|nr:bifunctional alpha/beta hydrolase/OsmC family protein [Arenibacter sp. GZD-96]MEA1786126.1 bifunctional alpha/beta hydrolase/OsmC family protein [Arenibacter sp. GZD-96]